MTKSLIEYLTRPSQSQRQSPSAMASPANHNHGNDEREFRLPSIRKICRTTPPQSNRDVINQTRYSAISLNRIMMTVDFEQLNQAFNSWAQEQAIPAGDGKSLRNTVSNWDNCQQNFISMVSLFSHEQGSVIGTAIMENKKNSEINLIQELIKQLKLEHRLFTLDALHCQKNS